MKKLPSHKTMLFFHTTILHLMISFEARCWKSAQTDSIFWKLIMEEALQGDHQFHFPTLKMNIITKYFQGNYPIIFHYKQIPASRRWGFKILCNHSVWFCILGGFWLLGGYSKSQTFNFLDFSENTKKSIRYLNAEQLQFGTHQWI